MRDFVLGGGRALGDKAGSRRYGRGRHVAGDVERKGNRGGGSRSTTRSPRSSARLIAADLPARCAGRCGLRKERPPGRARFQRMRHIGEGRNGLGVLDALLGHAGVEFVALLLHLVVQARIERTAADCSVELLGRVRGGASCAPSLREALDALSGKTSAYGPRRCAGRASVTSSRWASAPELRPCRSRRQQHTQLFLLIFHTLNG